MNIPLKIVIMTIVMFALVVPSLRAAELTPQMTDGQLGATLSNIAWPDTLARDLASGLENRILIRVSMLSNSKSIAQVEATLFVKFDLWDEVFRLRTAVGVETRHKLEFNQVHEVIAYLSKLELMRLFAVNVLPQGQIFALRAEVLINPVEREKIERLRKWVAANSAPNGITGARSVALSSKPNDLFNTIFEQYVAGDDLAAPWKVTVLSANFDPKLLPVRPPSQ